MSVWLWLRRKFHPALPALDRDVLPDLPNVWSRDVGGFKQRWLPGAFGDRTDISDVWAYKVEEDEWGGDHSAGFFRMIKRAEVTETVEQGRARGVLR